MLAVTVTAAAAAWHLYSNRTPPCDSLAGQGARFVDGGYCVVPQALEVGHPWDWRRLPKRLVVHGDLSIKGTHINALPEGLVVDGSIYLYKTDIDALPLDVWAKGGISQYAGMYSSIPDEQLAAWHARHMESPARPRAAPSRP